MCASSDRGSAGGGEDRTAADEPEAERSAAAGGASGGRELELQVTDMDCADCALRIREGLQQVEGVGEVEGNPVSRRVRVRFDESRVAPERIRRELGELGYASRETGEGPELSREDLWSGPEALRTYGAGLFFLTGVALQVAGAAPTLLPLPVHDLALPDLLFVAAGALGGWNFFPAGLRSARRLSLDMNFLMTVAILGAVAVGEFLEAGAIAFLFSVAELLEEYSVDRARRSIQSLMDLSPETATVIRDGRQVTVRADEVEPGDTVVVRPGERIPADGEVTDGASAVDESPITGESMPAEKAAGDEVYAGTINEEGFLEVRVTRAGDATTLSRVIHLVEEAESHRAPTERFVEKFARWYTPAVTGLAVLVAAVPPLLFAAPFGEWFVRGLTLLVIACPCALVISTPVAVVSGITAGARNGVLIKGGNYLEAMGEVEVIALDKTGTLTRSHMTVTDVHPLGGRDEEEVLARAAAVEARSEHPIGRAVTEAASSRGIAAGRWSVEGFEAIAGKGARARLDGEEWLVGRPELFSGAALPADLLARLRSGGKTAVVVGGPDGPAGVVGVGDPTRAGAAGAIERLNQAGVRRVVMLTGDHRETAEAVAAELGLDDVRAELLPQEKVEAVRELEREHGRVAMVGDGVNDAPALAAATVGVAMGAAGSDTALQTADIALMGDDLRRLPYLYALSHRGRGVIRQNIWASIGAKAVLAAGVPFGLVSLIVAVLVGDMGASLGVTANSLRLARVRG